MSKKQSIYVMSILLFVTLVLSFVNLRAQDPNEQPGSGEIVKFHSQVVGCGSKLPEHWKPGCCEGYGGCVDQCEKEIEYCD